jgi:ATP-dependent RNA helicase DeaD
MTDEVAAHLKENGYHAEALHGDLSQGQRDRVMNGFRSGAVTILVATDVAARGIDVDDVDLVFNYDLPQDNEYYVHRIGRTGRAGRQGVALSFVSGKDFYRLRDISRYAKTKIKLKRVPSATNVMESKAKKLFAKMEHSINEEDLTKYMVMIEEMADAKDYTAMQVAAALLKEIIGDNQPKKEEHKVNAENTGAKEKGMARLFLNIGKRQRVRPGDILGAIAGETEISGDQVGTIDMFDKFSFVEVPAHIAGDVLKAMEQVKIKGKKIRIELANDKR